MFLVFWQYKTAATESCKVCCLLCVQRLPGVHVWTAVSVELKTPELRSVGLKRQVLCSSRSNEGKHSWFENTSRRLGVSAQNKNSAAAVSIWSSPSQTPVWTRTSGLVCPNAPNSCWLNLLEVLMRTHWWVNHQLITLINSSVSSGRTFLSLQAPTQWSHT